MKPGPTADRTGLRLLRGRSILRIAPQQRAIGAPHANIVELGQTVVLDAGELLRSVFGGAALRIQFADLATAVSGGFVVARCAFGPLS
jgi:hypothetical protein